MKIFLINNIFENLDPSIIIQTAIIIMNIDQSSIKEVLIQEINQIHRVRIHIVNLNYCELKRFQQFYKQQYTMLIFFSFQQYLYLKYINSINNNIFMNNFCQEHKKELLKLCMNEYCTAPSRLLCEQCDYSLIHQTDPIFNYVDNIQTLSNVDLEFQQLKKGIVYKLNLTQTYLECTFYIYYKFIEESYNYTKDKLKEIRIVLQEVDKEKQSLNNITFYDYINAVQQDPSMILTQFIDRISMYVQKCVDLKYQLMNKIINMKLEEQQVYGTKFLTTSISEEDKVLFLNVSFNLHCSQFFYPYQIDKHSIEVSILFYFLHNTSIYLCNNQGLDLLQLMKPMILSYLDERCNFIAAYLHFKLKEVNESNDLISKNENKINQVGNQNKNYQQYNGFLYLKAIMKNQYELPSKQKLIEYAICQDPQCFYLITEKILLCINQGTYQLCIQFIGSLKENVFIQDMNYYLGISYLGIGDFQEAINNLKKSIYLNKYHIDSYIKLALVYFKMDIYELSKKAIEKLIQVIPNCSRAYFSLYDLEIQYGNIDKANEAAEFAWTYCEKHVDSYVYFARKLQNERNHVGALEILNIIKGENNYDAVRLIEELVEIYIKNDMIEVIEYIEILKQIDPIRSFQDLLNIGIEMQQSYSEWALRLFDLMFKVYGAQAVQIQNFIGIFYFDYRLNLTHYR
ncbi:hypothetical protein pb186bvf_002116 [Paramecium bursaria]